ncbi:MAG: methyltransferase domain-containing protein, partial [Burkholderiaceae bacterium]
MSTAEPDRLAYQFDLHARYRALAGVLQASLPDGDGPRTVLDVGAGPSRLVEAFLPPGWATVVRTDVDAFGDPSIVVVPPGAPLPYPDGAFDAVVSMDVLEHVLPEQRDAFLRECLRVARGVAVIAAPLGCAEVRDAEVRYAAVYRDLVGRSEAFLDEHAAFGLPESAAVGATLAAAGARVVELDNVRIADWIATNVVDLAFSLLNDGMQVKDLLARGFNDTLPVVYRDAAHYRRFWLATRDDTIALRLRALADRTALPSATGHSDDPLAVVVRSFRDYASRFHGPTLEAVVADRDRKIHDAASLLADKDAHITKLEADLVRAAEVVTSLESTRGELVVLQAAIAAKDGYIEGLQGVIDAKDRHITGLEAQFAAISNTP